LIQALDDSEQQINLNSQVIINYLAEPEGLKALENWKKRQPETFSIPNSEPLTENIYLNGNSSDLISLVRKNIYLFQLGGYDEKDTFIELVAYNTKTRTALFEIVQGQIFTQGWHSAIKFEGDKWRIIAVNNVWQS
jgi:hypothetical protein